jgi:hypothetical protein
LNKIGAQGAQHIANALQINKVTTTLFIIYSTFTHHLTQTINTLNLEYNQIGDQGAQHIANALQTNKVTASLFIIYFIFTITSHRHSPH